MVNFYYISNLRLIYFSYLILISFIRYSEDGTDFYSIFFVLLLLFAFVSIYSIVIIEMLVITYKSKNEKDIKFFLYNKKKK